MSCTTAILSADAAGVRRAAAALRAGELVAVPTETVYGLAARALDPVACRAIFTVKGRPLIDPLIVHVRDIDEAARLADVPAAASRLAAAFWPGPLTMVLRKHAAVPDLVTAGRTTVALRAPSHPLLRDLLAACDFPLAAPSANPFGYISPTRAEHVRDSLGGRIRWILDGGPCAIGIESTIIDLTTPAQPRLLRPGAVPVEAIAAALGIPVDSTAVRPPAGQTLTRSATDFPPTPSGMEGPAPSGPRPDDTAVVPPPSGMEAPGMLARHYSPRTPLRLFIGPPPAAAMLPGAGVLLFLSRPAAAAAGQPDTAYWLSEGGDQAEVARNLFDLLRRLDGAGHPCIWAELPEARGLGHAIRDRLERAAAVAAVAP